MLRRDFLSGNLQIYFYFTHLHCLPMTETLGFLLADSDPQGLAYVGSQVLLWARVAIGIGLVIFVHELGHFVAAKTFGVKCEKFYVGFDVPIKIGPIKFPRTLGKFTYGETEYGIGIIPLGGYVKMLGQDDDPRKAEEEAERIKMSGGDPESDAPVELDPRSYPAKAVWQRMIIISAGVVMNLITGVMFAAIAFGYGVPYTPSIIGGVTPGGPAWKAGMTPGGQVVSVDGLNDEQMHFREMRSAIGHAGLEAPDDPIDITVQYDGDKRKYDLVTESHPRVKVLRMIGITSPTSTRISNRIALPGTEAARVLSDDDAKAEVIRFNDTDIDAGTIVPGTALFDHLHRNPDKSIRLTLKRADGSTHEVVLPPQPSKYAGIRFAIGPVTALIKDGPAQNAGLKEGDVITAVDGSSEIDSESLLLHLVKKQPTELTVLRGKESLTITITPDDAPQTLSPTPELTAEAAVNAFGFAFEPQPTVAAFDSDRLDAATETNQALSAGDKIKELHVLIPDDEMPEELQEGVYADVVKVLREGWEFDETQPVTALCSALQILPEGTRIKVHAESAETGVIVTSFVTVGKDDRFRFERGIAFEAAEKIQTATSVGQAIGLGFREGRRRIGEVGRFLRMLVRGQVSKDQVGGPIKIFQIAGSEAERGVSAQLLFLTMLSMNLAVLNFLPIPALDGGHMVFLTAELIRGKRVNEELEMRLTLAGVLALLALMAFVIFNDITNF